jgi:hypothetical protein
MGSIFCAQPAEQMLLGATSADVQDVQTSLSVAMILHRCYIRHNQAAKYCFTLFVFGVNSFFIALEGFTSPLRFLGMTLLSAWPGTPG